MKKLRMVFFLVVFLSTGNVVASCIVKDNSDEQNFIACQLLANEGDVEAINAIASMYEHGQGVDKDSMKAFRQFERSANLGNVTGQYNLGRLYEQGVNGARNTFEAVNWLKKAADQQYTLAMDYLARIYFHGRGVNRSYEKSYHWIARSGGATTAEKHYFIGYLSLKGHVINKNLKDAHSHLLTAAQAGLADAQYHLGEMYRLGEYVEADEEKALSWLKKAMLQNHEPAELGIKKIERKREHKEYAMQQKKAAFKPPHIEIKVVGLPNTKEPARPARQNEDSGGWGLHILLFFIVLIVAAILLLRNRSSSGRDMTEQEKEVINQALKTQLETQTVNKPEISKTVEDKPQQSPGDDFYDNSLLDIAKQELEMNTVDKALWDQVTSEANGDMARAELLYLKKRVQALMAEK